tara:strand:- start:530 stop:1081 length:552 start_codon:yes stop_codon:yes gene_type:complete
MNIKNINVKKYQHTINLIKTKKYDESILNLKNFIEEDRNDYYAHQLISLVYMDSRNFDQAIKHLDISISINSENPGAYYNLGVIYRNLKKFDKSQEFFLKTIEKNPNFIDAYLNIAKIYENNQNFNEADKFYQKALLIDNKNLSSNKLYSNFLIKNGEVTKGLAFQYKYFGAIRFGENELKMI